MAQRPHIADRRLGYVRIGTPHRHDVPADNHQPKGDVPDIVERMRWGGGSFCLHVVCKRRQTKKGATMKKSLAKLIEVPQRSFAKVVSVQVPPLAAVSQWCEERVLGPVRAGGQERAECDDGKRSRRAGDRRVVLIRMEPLSRFVKHATGHRRKSVGPH